MTVYYIAESLQQPTRLCCSSEGQDLDILAQSMHGHVSVMRCIRSLNSP